MSEITREIPAIPPNTPPELAGWLEENLRRIQQEIWQIRQFLEPAIKNNDNCPNQTFSPLE